MFGIPWIEWIGYVGSVMVAVSLTMSSIKKLRWYNLVGASVFSFYGFMIGSLPVGLLNLFIVFTNIYYLFRMYSNRDDFKLIRVANDDAYLSYFLQFHRQDISTFFPSFTQSAFTESSKRLTFLLIRNSAVAGVVSGILLDGTFNVDLDYVTAPYRDLKPGCFVYRKNSELLVNEGIKSFEAQNVSKIHRRYLLKMGFKEVLNNPNVLVKSF